MARRTGVGATLAAGLVFSSLLFSSFVILVASENSSRLENQANEENYLSGLSRVLEGSGALYILEHVQGTLGLGPFRCSNVSQALRLQVGTISQRERQGPLTVTLSASVRPAGNMPDNLSLVSPFNGSAAGSLDLQLNTSARGSFSYAGVDYFKAESHWLHFPLRLGSLASLCLESMAELESTLEGLGECNVRAVGGVIAAKEASLNSAAHAEGFELNFSYNLNSQECAVELWTMASQEVSGPAGPFNFHVEQEETVRLPASNLTTA